MATTQRKREVYTGIKGRDGSTTASIEVPPHKALECLNVDFFRAALGRKRGGAAAHSLTGSGLSTVVHAAFRHVPGADETAAELWLIDSLGAWARYAGGAWSNPTIKDAITGNVYDVNAASFNGKLYFAYKSAVDRAHVWDGSTVRRTGLATPAAATVANTGAGAYAATARWYKVAYRTKSGSSILRQSEWSESVTFTPSGAGTAARVTKPAAITEGETHWAIAGAAAEDGPYYELSDVVVGTTTYDDSTNPSDYSGGNAISEVGEHTNWTSVKHLFTDGNRLLGAGSHETGGKNNRVWISGIPGTTSAAFADEETVPTDVPPIDFDENDSGFITGFGGPVENQVVVFKNKQSWRLIPTGIASTPYRRKPITKVIGSVRQQGVVMAEDEAGNPTLYWIARPGPYRLGPHGMGRLVGDLKDLWDTFNPAAAVTCHGVFHEDKHQIWWWIAVSAEGSPGTTKIVFDTRLGRIVEAGSVRDGWVRHTGDSANAICSVMFSNTIGATMSRDLKPYIGQNGAAVRFWKCDTSDTSDNGTAFQAYVDFPDRHFGGIDHQCQVFEPLVLAAVGSATLTLSLIRDYGEETRAATTTIAAAGTETRTLKTFEGGFTADAKAVKARIGDGSAVASAWTLDALIVPYEAREAVTA
jgi:hypothetical protein